MELIRNLQNNGNLNNATISEGLKQIKEKLTNPDYKDSKSIFLLEYVEKHISHSSGVRKEATQIQYRYCKKQLENFEEMTKTKLTFDKIDHEFYNTFMNYLQNDLTSQLILLVK